jgi:SAM-dependent methyltransferase
MTDGAQSAAMRTTDASYADHRLEHESAWWKRLLDVQRPYRAHLRNLKLGFVLEVGSGVGRNLEHLRGSSVGVDHNARAIEIVRSRGLTAFLPDDLRASAFGRPGSFDSLLFSHVIEHMTPAEASDLVAGYLDLLRDGGRVVVVTPQEAGFRSDPTHVELMDFATVGGVLRSAGIDVERQYSFPLPRFFGRFFKYNEFVTLGRKRAG